MIKKNNLPLCSLASLVFVNLAVSGCELFSEAKDKLWFENQEYIEAPRRVPVENPSLSSYNSMGQPSFAPSYTSPQQPPYPGESGAIPHYYNMQEQGQPQPQMSPYPDSNADFNPNSPVSTYPSLQGGGQDMTMPNSYGGSGAGYGGYNGDMQAPYPYPSPPQGYNGMGGNQPVMRYKEEVKFEPVAEFISLNKPYEIAFGDSYPSLHDVPEVPEEFKEKKDMQGKMDSLIEEGKKDKDLGDKIHSVKKNDKSTNNDSNKVE